ncbi:hypothetical protein [Piscinibacter gummiphilus]|uniref:DUF1574 domain-containing protein n=1 Tax=Piscinibacter gummiphilus TaxID=946333 RepID=A0ABZ0D062_9BURK|nr:hypothetical protein [Piscinibacter gummiphilus]WOB10608.1 hypothetical protein RXV79_11245 [Piscinibacter gummiphilus]
MKTLWRPALLFCTIGLLLYLALYAAAEQLLQRQGHSNPVFRVEQLPPGTADWVVLGASHAMPLGFAGVNESLEQATGQRLVQLAGPGTGPLYNRWVFEHYLQSGHRARHLLYVVDSFAFYSRTWNEDRLADAKLLARTPWRASLAASLARHVAEDGVDPRALLDYTTGFSKINNRNRFEPDAWEGEAQFDRSARASATATRKRIAYLYPQGTPEDALTRYMDELARLLGTARAHGMTLHLLKMPLPAGFRRQLPDEGAFDAALAALALRTGAEVQDQSRSIDDATLYFDSDHLNRQGLARFSEAFLVPWLRQHAAPGTR